MIWVKRFVWDEAGTARDEYFLLITSIVFTVFPFFYFLLLSVFVGAMADLQMVASLIDTVPDLVEPANSVINDQVDTNPVDPSEVVPSALVSL